MLAAASEHNVIVSPHNDVPEEDFYRHVGNTSFGKSLQIRQLFNWCMIRSLRNMEKVDDRKLKLDSKKEGYVDPKKIAMIIMEEFVNDLRKGTTDIDWEAEETSNSVDESIDDGEDTELRELFEEEDEEDEEEEKDLANSKAKAPSKTWLARKFNAKRVKIPNSKNVSNEKNLQSLQGRILDIQHEIEDWAQVLDNTNVGTEWEKFSRQSPNSPVDNEVINEKPRVDDIERELSTKMDHLYIHSHLLQSSSSAISQLSTHKLNKLSQKFLWKVNDDVEQINAKTLLIGLSKSLLE